MMTIYVGNLNFRVTENEIKALFEQYGTVDSVKLIIDKITNKPRGFGFITMEDDNGTEAISHLNGVEFNGRNLKVNEAKEKTDQDRRSQQPRKQWASNY